MRLQRQLENTRKVGLQQYTEEAFAYNERALQTGEFPELLPVLLLLEDVFQPFFREQQKQKYRSQRHREIRLQIINALVEGHGLHGSEEILSRFHSEIAPLFAIQRGGIEAGESVLTLAENITVDTFCHWLKEKTANPANNR